MTDFVNGDYWVNLFVIAGLFSRIFNPLQPTGDYMYQVPLALKFNNSALYPQNLFMFRMIPRINSDHFPKQD
jgi:hypothetical protein